MPCQDSHRQPEWVLFKGRYPAASALVAAAISWFHTIAHNPCITGLIVGLHAQPPRSPLETSVVVASHATHISWTLIKIRRPSSSSYVKTLTHVRPSILPSHRRGTPHRRMEGERSWSEAASLKVIRSVYSTPMKKRSPKAKKHGIQRCIATWTASTADHFMNEEALEKCLKTVLAMASFATLKPLAGPISSCTCKSPIYNKFLQRYKTDKNISFNSV